MRTTLKGVAALHAVAAFVVVLGVLAQVVRPLAPDLGPAPEPGRWFSPAFLATVDEYRSPLRYVGLAAIALRLAVPWSLAVSSPGRALTGAVVRRVGPTRPARAAAAVAVLMIATTDVVILPLSFWAGYVHEGQWGFRTQGLAGWAYDWAVANILVWLVAGAATLVGYRVIRRLPQAWPPVLGLGAAAAGAVLVFLSPLILEPLRFNTRPLPQGPVRAEVQRVLDQAGEEVDAIVVADASRRTTKQNAYVSGLGGTRRVVLYDTLVRGQPAEQVGLILAHELAHDRHGDVLRGTLLGAAGTIGVVYVLAAVLRRRPGAGSHPGAADPSGAALVVALVITLNVVSSPLQGLVSRRAEAAADLGALRITEDPQTYLGMMQELARENLSDPAPPAWAYLLWWSHPPTAARLEMGERWPFTGR